MKGRWKTLIVFLVTCNIIIIILLSLYVCLSFGGSMLGTRSL